MQRLSILLFSRNHVYGILDLIKDVYEIGDEIVLVDSSDRKEREQLHEAKKANGWHKLHIFYIFPTGLVETARPYGLMKCRYAWILYLDADERLSEGLKKDIRSIIDNSRYDAFSIKRYENVVGGTRKDSFFTWNIRLYKRDNVRYRGIIHEQPIVKGRLGVLEDEYYLENRSEFKNPLTGQEYSRLSKLERMSYNDYNEVMLDYFKKVFMPGAKEIKDTGVGRTFHNLLLLCERIRLKDQGEELSGFDYFSYNITKGFVFMTMRRHFKGYLKLLPDSMEDGRRIQGWKDEPDGKEIFEISKIIRSQGIIKFLGLDNEKKIMEINRKYKDSDIKGAELLMLLLKMEYKKINRLSGK